MTLASFFGPERTGSRRNFDPGSGNLSPNSYLTRYSLVWGGSPSVSPPNIPGVQLDHLERRVRASTLDLFAIRNILSGGWSARSDGDVL